MIPQAHSRMYFLFEMPAVIQLLGPWESGTNEALSSTESNVAVADFDLVGVALL